MLSANQNMIEILFARFDKINLPAELNSLLESGITSNEEIISLNALDTSLPMEGMDLTGYECLVNHIHVDDYVDDNLLSYGMAFYKRLIGLLKTYPEKKFRVILAYDDLTCSVRFHLIREGEEWLSANLDSYHEESILSCIVNE